MALTDKNTRNNIFNFLNTSKLLYNIIIIVPTLSARYSRQATTGSTKGKSCVISSALKTMKNEKLLKY